LLLLIVWLLFRLGRQIGVITLRSVIRLVLLLFMHSFVLSFLQSSLKHVVEIIKKGALVHVRGQRLLSYVTYSLYQGSGAWGDVRQAIIFHTVRKYLLRLDQRPGAQTSGKLWR
jgi:hypothetical protein